jgi:hypothetical protein
MLFVDLSFKKNLFKEMDKLFLTQKLNEDL